MSLCPHFKHRLPTWYFLLFFSLMTNLLLYIRWRVLAFSILHHTWKLKQHLKLRPSEKKNRYFLPSMKGNKKYEAWSLTFTFVAITCVYFTTGRLRNLFVTVMRSKALRGESGWYSNSSVFDNLKLISKTITWGVPSGGWKSLNIWEQI